MSYVQYVCSKVISWESGIFEHVLSSADHSQKLKVKYRQNNNCDTDYLECT